MKDTLTFIITHIVDHADAVVIEERVEETRTVFIVHVHEEDMGKVIGKQGRIIRAIRDLTKLIATKEHIYVDVELAEHETPDAQPVESAA